MQRRTIRAVLFHEEGEPLAHTIEGQAVVPGKDLAEAQREMLDHLPELLRLNLGRDVLSELVAEQDIIDLFNGLPEEAEVVEVVRCEDLGLELEFHFRTSA